MQMAKKNQTAVCKSLIAIRVDMGPDRSVTAIPL